MGLELGMLCSLRSPATRGRSNTSRLSNIWTCCFTTGQRIRRSDEIAAQTRLLRRERRMAKTLLKRVYANETAFKGDTLSWFVSVRDRYFAGADQRQRGGDHRRLRVLRQTGRDVGTSFRGAGPGA